MSKKCIFSVVVLCLLGISSSVFAGAWTFQNDWHDTQTDPAKMNPYATHSTSDWFDGNNWACQVDSQWNPRGGRCRVPDWAVSAALEPQAGGDPCVATTSPYYSGSGGASCSWLAIMPWSWSGAGNHSFALIDMPMNCGQEIGIATQTDFISDTFGHGVLDVNGGTMTTPGLNNFDINEPNNPDKHDDPNYIYIMGEGLVIGGGQTQSGACWGTVNIRNSAVVDVPRVRINYGDINLLPTGLLYIHSPNDLNLVISLGRATNRINVAGGEFRYNGDNRDKINYYIGKGKIQAYANRGMLSLSYDGTDTHVTAEGSNAKAWLPYPMHQAINIVRNPTLTWNAGDFVNNGTSGMSESPKHQVYFGADAAAVAAATTTSPEYKGAQDACSISLSGLEADTSYYWRIDEVNDFDGNSPWTGWVWSFRTLGGSAIEPIPADLTVGLTMPLQLKWTPGAFATGHDLYVGTDFNNVTDSTLGTAAGLGVFETNLMGTSNTTFALGGLTADLAKDTNYFWRVDETNNASGVTIRWKGFTWMFRNTNYFIIDDFNGYSTSADMNVKWTTGYSGSNDQAHCYGDVMHAGLNLFNNNAMQFTYTNNGSVKYSETRFVANNDSGADWTGGGALPASNPVVNVSVSFLGAAANTADPVYDRLYMALEDTSGNFYVQSVPDANATRNFSWTEWSVSLANLGVPTLNLASVKYLYLGAGDRVGCNIQIPGGTGTVTFDDVRLYQRHCVADYNKPIGDFTNDCVVNYSDLDYMVNNWLTADTSTTLATTVPPPPVAWYKFDESGGTTAADVCHPEANNATVLNENTAMWSPTGGFDGAGCINLVMNSNTIVEIPPAVLNFLNTKNSLTLSIWIKMDYYSPTGEWPRLISIWEPNAGGTDTEVLETECPTPRPPSSTGGPTVRARWGQADSATSDDNQSAQMSTLDFARQWNHYAFVKDAGTHIMKVYHNGYAVIDYNGAAVALPSPPFTGFRLGCRLDSIYEQHWVGSIDDFRVYDKALSAAEVAYIGTRGTGAYSHPMADAAAVANIYTADTPGQRVNLRDYAVLVSHWMQQAQWP